MKKAEKYYNDIEFPEPWKIIRIIKQAQLDAISETTKLCAKTGVSFLWTHDKDFNIVGNIAQGYSEDLKKEILNCKEILIDKL